jgi:metal-responsive CopG/Arc/MetJ family transcriptional regulator
LENIKDKRINILVSAKMMSEFEEALAKNEETKSEMIRNCIREYIKNNK